MTNPGSSNCLLLELIVELTSQVPDSRRQRTDSSVEARLSGLLLLCSVLCLDEVRTRHLHQEPSPKQSRTCPAWSGPGFECATNIGVQGQIPEKPAGVRAHI